MIYSMTGYGKGSAVKNNFSAEVEIKSVNSRFLELFLKLPPLLSDKEYELREMLKSKLKRGKINVVFQLNRNGNDNLAVMNETKLNEYISLIEKIKKTAGINEEIKIEHLLSNREIISSPEISLSETEFKIVKKALKNALNELLIMRKNEGEELAKDLTKRIESIKRKVNSVEREFKKNVKSYYIKLKDRLKILIREKELDEQRLNLELAAIADKADITEECVRLKSHLKFFIDSMSNQAEPGRKLNFLCQELNREANTISSKSISTSVTHNAVMIKEEIEKIREQIQNIE